MEEIVLKREASVTSAEALDQINSAYPDAEILSFRRIKEAGSSSEFFITRVRFAALGDGPAELTVEDAGSERTEDEKMSEIINLLKELVDKVEDDEVDEIDPTVEEDPMPASLEDDHEAKPLPELQEPAFGVGGTATDISPIASLVVERKADVSKSLARLELIREFSPEYKIGSIEKQAGVFRVSLYKTSALRESALPGLDEYLEKNDRKQQQREYEKGLKPEEDASSPAEEDLLDENGIPVKPPKRFPDELFELSPLAREWLNFLDEAGLPLREIVKAQQFMEELPPRQQGEWIEQQVTEDSVDGVDFYEPSSGFGIGPEGTGPKTKPGQRGSEKMDPSFTRSEKTPRGARVVLPEHLKKQIEKWHNRNKGVGAGALDKFKVANEVQLALREKIKELGRSYEQPTVNEIVNLRNRKLITQNQAKAVTDIIKKQNSGLVSDKNAAGKALAKYLDAQSQNKHLKMLERIPPDSQMRWIEEQFAPAQEKQQVEETQKARKNIDISQPISEIVTTMGDSLTPGDAYNVWRNTQQLQRTQLLQQKIQQEDEEKNQIEAPAQTAVMDPQELQLGQAADMPKGRPAR